MLQRMQFLVTLSRPYVSDLVKLNLIDAYVLPIMICALKAGNLTRGQHDELSVCWNNLFRRANF